MATFNGPIAHPSRRAGSKGEALRLMPRGIKNQIAQGTTPTQFQGLAHDWLLIHQLIADGPRGLVWTRLGLNCKHELERLYRR